MEQNQGLNRVIYQVQRIKLLH